MNATLDTIKTRIHPSSNYRATWFNGRTIRQPIDSKKPVTELEYPEFLDVKITDQCRGNCPYCYQSSTESGCHASNAVQRINDYFGPLTENQRPFQVAIGGGEPTEHPEFIEILEAFYDLGICPNYTTNGMLLAEGSQRSKAVLEATKLYCGGVAVTAHEHLERAWRSAAELLIESKIRTNLHCIISDIASIFELAWGLVTWPEIEYFVLLPLTAQGRATEAVVDHDVLFDLIDQLKQQDQDRIAYGALFYPELLRRNRTDVGLYEPELMSKYLDLSTMTLYPSSFSMTPIN